MTAIDENDSCLCRLILRYRIFSHHLVKILFQQEHGLPVIHLPYLVIPRIIVDIIPTQVIFFDCFGYAVIHFPLVETSAFDDVDMVFEYWTLP